MKAIRKYAYFAGYTLYHGERFNIWRCPNRKCGMHVSEDYVFCPHCGQKIKFKKSIVNSGFGRRDKNKNRTDRC